MKQRRRRKRRIQKYCEFHKANGNTTQECYDFRTYLYSKYHVENLPQLAKSPPRGQQ